MKNINVYNDGKIWVLGKPWYEEIMQTVYINANELYVYYHSRRQGDDKYSLQGKRFTICISLNTPQVANILKEKSINEALAAVEKIGDQYLKYAYKGIAPDFVKFTNPYGQTEIEMMKDKLTEEQLIKELGISENEYKEKLVKFNPYK